MLNYWDSIFTKYIQSQIEDKNSDFAYEKYVNTPSILSLCNEEIESVLDLGCGDGRFTKILENNFKRVYAIDNSNEMLKKAKSVCSKTTFINHDIEQPFPIFKLKFDLVSCKLVLMYLHDLDNIAKESFKILKKSGSLVISVTHPLKWISEEQNESIKRFLYKGYLSEVGFKYQIAHIEKLNPIFFNHTLQTYINTFTKNGFKLEALLEMGAPDAFVIKYPQYLSLQYKPFRLNMKFIKDERFPS